MSDRAAPVYYYPNKMGRIILQAIEEVVGRTGLNAALNLANLRHRIGNYPPNNLDKAFAFDELGHLQAALDSLYGPRAGSGLALRSGRACFKYGLRDFGPMLGAGELTFRLLPLEAKLKAGAELLSDLFNRFTDQQVRVEEKEDAFLWHIDRCPVCWRRHSTVAACHLAVGVLQEGLYWVSGGKFFSVEENLCIAKGDPTCTMVIAKQPLD